MDGESRACRTVGAVRQALCVANSCRQCALEIRHMPCFAVGRATANGLRDTDTRRRKMDGECRASRAVGAALQTLCFANSWASCLRRLAGFYSSGNLPANFGICRRFAVGRATANGLRDTDTRRRKMDGECRASRAVGAVGQTLCFAKLLENASACGRCECAGNDTAKQAMMLAVLAAG